MVCYSISSRVRRLRGAWFVPFLALVLVGCNGRPVAPPLDQRQRVYHNTEEGFSFEAPEKWSCHGIAHFPSGRHEQERLWVKYKNLDTNRPTFFRVSFIDLPEKTTLSEYLTNRNPGPENWRMLGVAEKTSIDGVEGVRYRFSGNWDSDSMIREIVAVKRGTRTIFFTGIHRVDDKKSREAIQATYKTVRWDKKG